MSKIHINLIYKGYNVDSGRMEINDLAPALLSFSDLIVTSNKILNGDKSTVKVYVESNFQKGSFEISLEIVYTLIEQIKLLITKNNAYNIGTILNMIGIGSTLSGCNLLELKRWINNRHITNHKKIDNNTVRIYIDEEQRDISIGVFKLLRSRTIQKKIEGILTPLQKDGVDSLVIQNASNQNITSTISKGDLTYFLNPNETIEDVISVEIKRTFLSVVAVDFENPIWTFKEDDNKFKAKIIDIAYLDRIRNEGAFFPANKMLVVDLKTVVLAKNGINKEHYFIVKVFN